MPHLSPTIGGIVRAIPIIMIALTSVSAQCTRDGLLKTAASYVAAQASGNLDGLNFTASNFTYQEDNKVIDIKSGVLSKALKLDLNRSTADTTACASYTMLISSSGPNPYVLATQIHHDGNDTNSITMIDTIAATTGSLFFNATLTLQLIQAEDWTTAVPGKPASRETLKQAGDAYLDMWTNATAADSIPWGSPCERVEGSMLTKPCNASLPRGGSTQPNSMRRYVIDETIGSVDVLCAFNSLGDYPDSHELFLDNGRVKYVHTITV